MSELSKSPPLEEEYPEPDDEGQGSPPVGEDNQGPPSHGQFNPQGFLTENETASTQDPPASDHEHNAPQSYADRFGHFASDRIPNTDDDSGDYTLDNLPNILFQLEAAVERHKRQNLGHIVIDGQVQYGQNGRALSVFRDMPFHISYGLEGFVMEYLKRRDRTITYPDITARMIDKEAVAWYWMNKRRKVAKKEAEDAAKGKGKGKAKSGEDEDNMAKPTLGMFSIKSLQGKIHNSLNNRRLRDCRVPLGAISWELRNTYPSKAECEAVKHLSEEQIRHNTTLNVTPQGLQRVRLEGQTGEKRKKIAIQGDFLPLGFFLTNGQPHVPSDRFQEARRIAADLDAKCVQRGLTNWDHLPTDELPKEWTGRVARSNATRMANKKRKLEGEEKILDENEDVLPSVEDSNYKRRKPRKPRAKNTTSNADPTGQDALRSTGSHPLGDGIGGPSTQPNAHRWEYPDVWDAYNQLNSPESNTSSNVAEENDRPHSHGTADPDDPLPGYYYADPTFPPPALFTQDPTLGGPGMISIPSDFQDALDPILEGLNTTIPPTGYQNGPDPTGTRHADHSTPQNNAQVPLSEEQQAELDGAVDSMRIDIDIAARAELAALGLFEATDPDFESTLARTMQDEVRSRMGHQDADGHEVALLCQIWQGMGLSLADLWR